MNNFSEADLIDFMKSTLANELSMAKGEVPVDVEFINFGLDSVRSIFILQRVEKYLGVQLNPLLLWDYPTIASFSKHLASSRSSLT